MFGLSEGLIILAIVILLFGGKKLPELGKALGQSLNSFKKGLKEDEPKIAKDKAEDNTKNS